MADISVIIVSWNTRALLKGCLESIAATGGALIREIIVVDNASTDGSPEMVAEEFPSVVLIRSDKNLGFARANNLGLQRARGSYVALVNSDVVVHEDCFQRLTEFLESNPGVGLTGPKIIGGDGKLQPSCRRLPTVWNTISRSLALDTALPKLFQGRESRCEDCKSPTDVEVLSGCFWLARREAVEKVGGLDERFFFYAEDVDWCKRFHDAGWKVFFVPTASATHFGGASSAREPLRYSIEMLRANLAYWRKHYGIFGQFLFYLLAVTHQTMRFVARGFQKISGRRASSETDYGFQRSAACLRWLFTGRSV